MTARVVSAGALGLLAVAFLLAACRTGAGQEDRAPPPRAGGSAIDIPLGLIEPDVPLDEPITAPKVELGKRLFFDKRLSLNEKVSCASCHDPNHGFAEPRAVSLSANGEGQRRNAPSLLNTGFLPALMWDGRFRSLEAQAREPFTKWGDMGIEIDEALERIDRDTQYVELFRRAFGSSPTAGTLARALATFERTLVSGNTRFDRYLYGREEGALTPLEKDGWKVFVNHGSCITCHDVFHRSVNPLGGRLALLTDLRFHNLGVGYSRGMMRDTGRFEVTRDPEDWGAFKTPSLRNIALTAPYMHDGSIGSLVEVVEFYDRGCTPNPNLSPGLRPLYLTKAQKRALVAFLGSLTDPKLERPRR
jgi:cytochrome c peroxidase